MEALALLLFTEILSWEPVVDSTESWLGSSSVVSSFFASEFKTVLSSSASPVPDLSCDLTTASVSALVSALTSAPLPALASALTSSFASASDFVSKRSLSLNDTSFPIRENTDSFCSSVVSVSEDCTAEVSFVAASLSFSEERLSSVSAGSTSSFSPEDLSPLSAGSLSSFSAGALSPVPVESLSPLPAGALSSFSAGILSSFPFLLSSSSSRSFIRVPS